VGLAFGKRNKRAGKQTRVAEKNGTRLDSFFSFERKQFSEEQLMQLGAQIAFENYRARWNRIFDVESDNLYMPQANKS
jgi:alkylhydroperoxidase family enzyme